MGTTDSGREPVQLVEIDQPICVNVYGDAPCTAALSSAFPNKCFNTRKTCQDADNFDLAVLPNTLRFCKAMQTIPREWGAIPLLDSVSTNPMVINPGGANRNSKALGARATVTIRMTDAPYSDLKTDPYQDERFSGVAQFDGVGYNPLDRGTFWTKWLRRNPYYNNWIIRVRDGYLEDSPNEMVTRNYIIQDISGPGPDGKITIKAQDIFGLADNDKVTCPVQSRGVLNADITDADMSVVLTEWVSGEYPATGTIRIDDEVMTYNGVVEADPICTLTITARGTDGTTAAAHDAGSRAQLCYRVADADDVYCWEVVQDLLENYANVPPEYIPIADWNTEGNTWLPTFTVTTLITEPTGINELLAELCQDCLFNIWWDERDQEIKFRALHPVTDDPVEINDRQNIIAGSWSLSSDMSQRVSQVWAFYAQRDPTKKIDETTNYSQVRIIVDPTLEQDEKYKEPRVKTIYSRWLESPAQAIQVCSRYLARFQDGAKFLKVRLDAKDRDIWTGTIVEATLHSVVSDVGLPEAAYWQVISANEVIPGEVVEYNMQNYYFIGIRYAYFLDPINIRHVAGQWTLSGSGTNEYYFDNSGGDLIGKPNGCYINEPTFMNSATEGVAGALAAGEWDWADNDGLGYTTVYVRLADGTDPDTKADGYIEVDYPAYGDLPDPDNPPKGAWYSDASGLMSDGTRGWSLQ